ncbi:MAG: hypothetical protein HY459_01010 [Parcubacteria group bacterium]|nr:hypothetical protein [Parcubacteria group bacterium]
MRLGVLAKKLFVGLLLVVVVYIVTEGTLSVFAGFTLESKIRAALLSAGNRELILFCSRSFQRLPSDDPRYKYGGRPSCPSSCELGPSCLTCRNFNAGCWAPNVRHDIQWQIITESRQSDLVIPENGEFTVPYEPSGIDFDDFPSTGLGWDQLEGQTIFNDDPFNTSQ